MLPNEIQLRFLSPPDVDEVKKLCVEWFPVEYPDTWYTDITSSERFYSLAATCESKIVGIIISEVRSKMACDREDLFILDKSFPDNTQITYILSIGVTQEYRRLGIASLLLETLLTHMKSSSHCKAVYLHVLWSNEVAIRFYERRNFEQRTFLPRYYTIDNQLEDGYCYVLYMNEGHPPWTFTDYLSFIWQKVKENNPCQYLSRLASSKYWYRALVLSASSGTSSGSSSSLSSSSSLLSYTSTSNSINMSANNRSYLTKSLYRIS